MATQRIPSSSFSPGGLVENATSYLAKFSNGSGNGIVEYSDIISNRAVRMTMIAIFAVAVIIALIGNGIVIVIILRRKKLHKNTTIIFIFNLAFSDFISCLVYKPMLLLELFLPFNKVFKFSYPAFHLEICQFVSYFQGLFAAVGFLTMMAISQERLFLIVYPLKAKQIWTSGRVKKILAFIWIFAIISVLPLAIFYSQIVKVKMDGIEVALCGTFEGNLIMHIYFVSAFVIYFAVPMVVMSITYAKIFAVLYYQPSIVSTSKDGNQEKMMQIRKNLAKMMLSVSVIFALCWGPNFLYFMYLSFGGEPSRNGFFGVILVEFLPIISSAVNPFLYTLNSRTFRKSMKRFCQRQTKETTSSDEPKSFQGNTGSGTCQLRNTSQLSKSNRSVATFGEATPPGDRRSANSIYRASLLNGKLHPDNSQLSLPDLKKSYIATDSDKEAMVPLSGSNKNGDNIIPLKITFIPGSNFYESSC